MTDLDVFLIGGQTAISFAVEEAVKIVRKLEKKNLKVEEVDDFSFNLVTL